MEWISVKDSLPRPPGALVKVRLDTGEELKAYYHADGLAPFFFYGQKVTYWQRKDNLKTLHNVVEWLRK